jgi:hypothetical protein
VKNAYSALHVSTQTSGSEQESGQTQDGSSAGDLRHGTWWERVKKKKPEEVIEGRFGQLFRDLRPARFDHRDLEKLADAMIASPEEPPLETDPREGSTKDPEENTAIPAAYTYLGQFADHDITFDPTSQLRESLTPARIRALADFRTPRFDLDNLYGRGPDDQPYMYCPDGVHMLLGDPLSGNPFDPDARQLPRGPTGRALIGDPRDDENRIVAQLHAIFLRFHNKVADHLAKTHPGRTISFEEVRNEVRHYYQWMLVTDFLPKVINGDTYQSVFPNPWRPVRTIPGLRKGLGLMPVEFSVAAYRFGHSMVRPNYRLNAAIQRPIFSTDAADTADLGGMRPIPDGWAIDWQLFIDLEHGATPAPGGSPDDLSARETQLSYKIDTSLANPLGHLPPRIAADPPNLALRNLQRGAVFGLPSGQDVAWILGVPAIADEKIMIGTATSGSSWKPITEVAPGCAGKAPLWTYILSEAQVTSWAAHPDMAVNDIPIKLGPVGGRLIAEVFAALLFGDPTSYLNARPAFRLIPRFAPNGKFGLAELINVALGRTR